MGERTETSGPRDWRYLAEQRYYYADANIIVSTADKSRVSRQGTFAGAIHAPLEAPRASVLFPQVRVCPARAAGREAAKDIRKVK